MRLTYPSYGDPRYMQWRREVLDALTKRQKKMLSYVMLGYTNQGVAKKLFRTENTIKTGMKVTARRLEPFAANLGVENIRSRTGQAVVFAYAFPLVIGEYSKWQSRVFESLTSRHMEVLRLVAAGLSNDEVGERLGLDGLTVKSHLFHMSQRIWPIGVDAGFHDPGSRTGLAVIASHAGILKEPDWL